jgi:hypothetical protein
VANAVIKHVRDKGTRKALDTLVNAHAYLAEAEYRRLIAQSPMPEADKSLASKRPDLAREWNYALNDPLTPEHFSIGSNKRVWWSCRKDMRLIPPP